MGTAPEYLPLLSSDEAASAPALIASYERALAPSEPANIARMMARIALLYPAQRLSDVESAERLALYTELLADIPGDILGEAFRKVAQTSRFFPSVAEIREAAATAIDARRARLRALQNMLAKQRVAVRPAATGLRRDMAEAKAVGDGLADLVKRLKAMQQ